MRPVLIAVIGVTLFHSGEVFAQSNPQASADDSRRDEILSILKVTGNLAKLDSVALAVVEKFRSKCTGVPEDVWAGYVKDLQSEMTAAVIPLYEKYYSAEDLKVLAKFYESPTYQRVQAVLSDINRDSREMGQTVGKRKAEEIIADLKSRGCFAETPKTEDKK